MIVIKSGFKTLIREKGEKVIKNRQQYKAACRELAALQRDVSTLPHGADRDIIDRYTEAVTSISTLEKDIKIYEWLQHIDSPLLSKGNFQNLPELVIAARIARGMSQKDLAEFMGMKMQQIQAYEAERYQSTTLSRLGRIADALGVNVHQVGELAGNRLLGAVDPTMVSRFPIGAMYKRRWLGPYSGSLVDLRHVAEQHLKAFFRRAYGARPVVRRRYVRANRIPHEGAISAWEARVMIRADAQASAKIFHPDLADTHWLRALMSLSAHRNGFEQVRQRLNEIGIVLIIEDALPGMRLDGAALRTTKDVYVLALTLRDPRAETFWITLMHELSHLILHIGTGIYDAVFDEIDAPAECDFEDEADVHARESVIPIGAWRSCKSHYEWTRQTIREDARRLGVGPAVVTGHIRRLYGDVELPNRLGENQNVRAHVT